MTRMIPDSVAQGTTTSERSVFSLILNDKSAVQSVCLHSLGVARHARKTYAEIDFVLVGPAGLYCFEVKGGEVRRKDGVWEIGWPGKTYTSVEGPFKQIQGARWALIDFLKNHVNPRLQSTTVLGWGVIFPDICFNEQDPEWDNAVVFDQRDKSKPFSEYVSRLERYFREELKRTGSHQPAQLSSAQISRIVDALRGDFDAVPSLKGLLIESEQELLALSPSQFRVLDYALEANARILCSGGAGTGKTVVAVEAARRLGRSGKSVLFLCFNRNLKHFLRLEEDIPNVEISTVYAFFDSTIRRAGLGAELTSARAEFGDEEFYSKVYADLFEKACSILVQTDELPQYDALIVDEAQDVLNAPVMNSLDLVLTNGLGKGRWLIFLDLGLQSKVYSRIDSAVIDHLRTLNPINIELRENFRNPSTVADEVSTVTGAPKTPCRRTLHSPVDYRTYTDDRDQGKKLRALLVELIGDGISPGLVSILSAVKLEDACAVRFPPNVGKKVEVVGDEPGRNSPEAFTVATISGFKGLENDIIVLTDISRIQDSDWRRALLYVGMTRPRTKLFVLITKDFLDTIVRR
jgi:hypothetical protein